MATTNASGLHPAWLPTVPFGAHQVTRLVCGGNPLCGGSHWSACRSREMADFHTDANVVAHLRRVVECGINTLQARGDYHRVLHWVELFRREGGRIQWIAQTASEMHDVLQNIRILAAAGAIGIYHHGSATDRFWAEGCIDQVRDYLTCMRDQGVRVGLGTHIPEVIEYVEEKGWDVDFYMTCVYNLNREVRQSDIVARARGVPFEDDAGGTDAVPTVNEPFLAEDPPRMLALVRRVERQCLVFKILGAGRQCGSQESVRQAFRDAYDSIKPQDIVVVGMWQKHRDEIGLNATYAREVLSAALAANRGVAEDAQAVRK